MFHSLILLLILCFPAFTVGQPTHARVGVCETIADDYLDLIMEQEMFEIEVEKHKEDRYWEKLLFQDWPKSTYYWARRSDGKFLAMELMKEMQQVREKILQSSLQSTCLLSSFPLYNGQNWTDGTASESQMRAFIQEDVARIYRQLRNLKIAEWNQENENEEGSTYPILDCKLLTLTLTFNTFILSHHIRRSEMECCIHETARIPNRCEFHGTGVTLLAS